MPIVMKYDYITNSPIGVSMTDQSPKPVLAFHGPAGIRVGEDRFALLDAVLRFGSIRAAAEHVGLSYKGAWDAINALNNLFPRPLVVARAGGRHGGGAAITDEGRRVLAAHRHLTVRLNEAMAELSGTLAGIGAGDLVAAPPLWSFAMKTSARNTYYGVISDVTPGAVNAEISIRVSDTTTLAVIITMKSVMALGLHVGREVFALIKASTPILVPEAGEMRTSARNRICGTVTTVEPGAVNSEVVLDIGNGKTLVAIITKESAENLGFKPGDRVCALIKASQIIIGVE